MVAEGIDGPSVIARAGSGVCYVCFARAQAASGGVIDYSPQEGRAALPLWPHPGRDFEIMRNIKNMLDPQHLLNEGRLYGRI